MHQIAHVGRQRAHGPGLKLFGPEINFREFQPLWSRYLIVTDGQIDESNLITALCASIAR